MSTKNNPAVYFEIPVLDMERAMQFYREVFAFEFEQEHFDGIEMAYLPFADGAGGISGALAKGESYVPAVQGVLLYLFTDHIGQTIERATAAGATILYPLTFHESIGVKVAEINDSEGNRIGLHQRV